MENRKKLDEINRRLSEISLSIKRVPSITKRDFISFANVEFSGDYGLCLKFIFDQAIEYQNMKALFFDKLQNMEDKIDSLINKQEQKKPTVIKRLGGRIESKGGEENE